METEFTYAGAFLQSMGNDALTFGLKLLSALAILLIGYLAKRLIRKLLIKLLAIKFKPHTIPAERVKSLNSFILAVYDCVAWFVIAIATISKLGIDVTSLLTVAGVGGIAVGFGAQTLVKDMLAGMLFFLENQYQPGDIIAIGDKVGTVEKMTLRTTAIRELSGDLYIIPNGEIRALSNMTRSFHRAIVNISVDYGEALDRVTKVLADELGKCYPGIDGLSAVPKCLGVTKLADSGVEMCIVADCEVKCHWAVERELRRRIKDRFDAEGIELSIPQIMVHGADKT